MLNHRKKCQLAHLIKGQMPYLHLSIRFRCNELTTSCQRPSWRPQTRTCPESTCTNTDQLHTCVCTCSSSDTVCASVRVSPCTELHVDAVPAWYPLMRRLKPELVYTCFASCNPSMLLPRMLPLYRVQGAWCVRQFMRRGASSGRSAEPARRL